MVSPEELPPLTESQLDVMQRIWERGEATATEIWKDLAENRDLARNTILTVMDRLAKRGWLTKRSVANTHLYSATVTQDSVLGNVVSRLVETALRGSADALVMALLDGRGVSDDEAKRIRKMIAEAKKKEPVERGARWQ